MRCFSKAMFGVFAAALGALVIVVLFRVTSWGGNAGPIVKVESTPVNRDAKPATSFAPVIKKAGPSVVNIYSTRIVQERATRNPFVRQFFGDQIPDDEGVRTQKELGFGSGVIVAPDGYILTANHVVAGMDEIKVAIANDKKEYTAKIIGTDPETDVAVLKIDAKDLPAITLGDSDQLEVGDIVLAIGNPFGIARQAGQTTSVTMGIISALGRNGVDFGGQPSPIQDFIQTDAAINPGNSGGALVDAEGRLVGINTGIETSSRGNEGIGFAVPINMARHVMERLINGGKVSRALIGVRLQDLDAGLVNYFSLPDQNGALVDDVTPGSSAAKAGVQSGDVIVAFNGKEITDANNLILAVSDCLPGSHATLKLVRDGNVKIINITLGEKTEQVVQNKNAGNAPKIDSSKTDALSGVTVSDIDRDARQELRIPLAIRGAIITDVAQGSNSADSGLQRGDVIEEINHQPVNSAEDALKICRQAKGDRIFLKIWQRGGALGSTRYLSVDNRK
ncbi:MAG TPA: Do family serine endopeptidase [Verrucomicrobiae bacterium]|jgi:serine protease Do|nr:Do family serine endopeptidase [Verrucomicrobiae bacterium]